MKISSTLKILFVAATFTSCSTVQKYVKLPFNLGKSTSTSVTEGKPSSSVDVEEDASQLLTSGKEATPSSSSQTVKAPSKHPKTMMAPQKPATVSDRKKGGKPAAAETPKKLNTKPTVEQLTGGQWNIIAVGEVNITAEDDTPYVDFDRNGRFYASDGCNIINGDYVLKNDVSLVFSNTLSTMKYCPDVEYSALIASIFNGGTKFFVDCRKIGHETYLYVNNEKGITMITLRRQNMEFLNGNWRITAVAGEKIDTDANIFIDIAEKKIHGNTGCNYFNGQLYVDPGQSNAIDFSNIGTTRMACPNNVKEHAIILALEETVSAIAGKNDNTALFLDRNGKATLVIKKIAGDDED